MRRLRDQYSDPAGEAGLQLPGLLTRLPQALSCEGGGALSGDVTARYGTVSRILGTVLFRDFCKQNKLIANGLFFHALV